MNDLVLLPVKSVPPSSSPLAGLRRLIQPEHDHHYSDAAIPLLLFDTSYTHAAEPHVEMK